MKAPVPAAVVAELAKRAGGTRELARRLGVSEGMVRHIVAGRKRPGRELAAKLAELADEHGHASAPARPTPPARTSGKAGKVPPRASSLAAESAKNSAGDVLSEFVEAAGLGRPAPARAGAIERLERLVDAVDEQLERAILDDASPTQLATLYRVQEGALSRLARLRGEGELNEAQIIRSQAFRRVMLSVSDALKAHPEAAKDLAEALERLKETGGL